MRKRLLFWSGLLVLMVGLTFTSRVSRNPVDMDLLYNFTDAQLAVFRKSVVNFYSKPKFTPHRELNLKPKHPVVMIPGFVTSGLEIWEADECISSAFRQRVWGSMNMVKLFIQNPSCWLKHMSLGPDGFDPPGIRLRPSHGFESGDFFIGQYFVWALVIEALGKIGYDANNMQLASFDWRLNLIDMEIRDRYFSRLAATIEQMSDFADEKVVIVTHSYGGIVWNFFAHWAQHHRGTGWIDKHVTHIYNVGASFLGVPKAFSALLAGEMSDTSTMGAFAPMLDALMNASERAGLWRSWGTLHSLIPKGGTKVWGRDMFNFDGKNSTLEEAIQILRTQAPNFSYHFDQQDAGSEVFDSELFCPNKTVNGKIAGKNACYKKEWTNPLASRLPSGNYTVSCIYGLGSPSETGYYFVQKNGEYRIDVSATNGHASGGVIYADGDVSVPSASLGYTCKEAWKAGSPQNPHNVTVRVREINHNFGPDNIEKFVLGISGKVESAEHVEILGHHTVLEDVVALAAGRADLINQ